MNYIESIGRRINAIANTNRPKHGYAFEAICTALDKESATISIKIDAESENIHGVRMQLYPNEHKIINFPAIDSHVVILCLNDDPHNLYLLAAELYQDVDINISGKFIIKNKEQDLKVIFADIMTAIESLILLSHQGPTTGISPKSKQDITKINDKLKEFFQ